MGVVLVLFLILAVYPAKSSQNSYGKKFIIAFPENIAFYHPIQPNNKIWITALQDNTNVKLDATGIPQQSRSLSRGGKYVFTMDTRLELQRSTVANKTLRIDSDKNITVHAIIQKVNSIQTALVVPVDNLGTKYQIPPVPRIEAISNAQGSESMASIIPERGPFKLTVINHETANIVTLNGAVKQNASLDPYQLAQFWLNESEMAWSVSAEKPVAVLLSHPCAPVANCTCRMQFTPLTPTEGEELKFLVPPLLAKGAESESSLLMTNMDEGATNRLAFDPEASSLVKTSGPAIFYRPGMLLSLIPIRDFSSCYVLHTIPNMDNNYALLVAPKDETDGVRLGKNPLVDPIWMEMKGTGYSCARIRLNSGKNVIWHTSSRMAVYFIGMKGNSFFGNPASSISKHLDYRGCVLTPEVLEIGHEDKEWAESLEFCRDNGTKLISLDTAEFQQHFATKLKLILKKGVKKAWIGLRRSSLTGEWYWLNKAAVGATNWAKGEPGTSRDGQCAMMSLDSKDDFGWRDEDCCTDAPPICYKEPELFPLE